MPNFRPKIKLLKNSEEVFRDTLENFLRPVANNATTRKTMKPDNCHRCGTRGATTLNRFTGDGYFAYCPKCLQFGPTIEGVTREDAVKEWNEINKEEQCR